MSVSFLVSDSIKRTLLFVITAMLVMSFVRASETEQSNIETTQAETELAVKEKAEAEKQQAEKIKKEEQQKAIVISKRLHRDLQRQYNQLQKVLETEDAFSMSLAESYFGYAGLLREAQRFDEAIDAYTTALHIEKVNHGIYSLRQRTALRSLFDMHLELGDIEQAEHQLQRILWIEDHNPDLIDKMTFDSILKLGNYYVDLFDQSKRKSERVMGYLRSASNLFVVAEEKFGKQPIAELLMPYGEIALVNYYLGKVAENAQKESNLFRSSFSRGGSYYGSNESAELNHFMAQSFRRAEAYLQVYIAKAYDEKQLDQLVYAIINFADLQLLFRKRQAAGKYYQIAWEQAQKLSPDHPIRTSFSKPVRLPAFNYAIKQKRAGSDDEEPTFTEIEVQFDVNKLGLAKNIAVKNIEEGLNTEQKKQHKRAMRTIRQSVFRPAIVEGKPVVTEQLSQNVKVFTKNKS